MDKGIFFRIVIKQKIHSLWKPREDSFEQSWQFFQSYHLCLIDIVKDTSENRIQDHLHHASNAASGTQDRCTRIKSCSKMIPKTPFINVPFLHVSCWQPKELCSSDLRSDFPYMAPFFFTYIFVLSRHEPSALTVGMPHYIRCYSSLPRRGLVNFFFKPKN